MQRTVRITVRKPLMTKKDLKVLRDALGETAKRLGYEVTVSGLGPVWRG